MLFHTEGDKAGQTPFTKLATFYIEKFPQAFKCQTTYTNKNGKTSEEVAIRVDVATSVTFEFESEEHAELFQEFQEQCLLCFQQKTDSEKAEFLLKLLLKQEKQILSLPTQIK